MYNFTRGKQLRRNAYYLTGFLLFFLFTGFSGYAQRTYTRIYSQNLKGGSITFGNTLMHILKNNGQVDGDKMNSLTSTGGSSSGNDNENMQYIDIDGSTGIGASTRNSSSANLVLPSGTNTIKFAYLYWGGKIKNGDFDLTDLPNKTIKIRKSTESSYQDRVAINMDKITVTYTGQNGGNYTEYQAVADVTDYIKTFGAGTYVVGNAALSTGTNIRGGAHGGWAIVVVYENLALPYNSVRVYDGFQEIYDGGSSTASTITLTGLDVPSGTMSSGDARMGVVTWEGDASIKGDFMKINGNNFSNTLNPSNNTWNSSITDNGVNVTTKNPNYSNQMGIDIDMFNVGTGYGINPGDQSVTLQFGTTGDRYFPGVFSFIIKMKDPSITLNKTVTTPSGNNVAVVGDVLTYNLTGKNVGIGDANYVEIRDTLPGGVTYVPGSLKVISSPGFTTNQVLTDAAGDDQGEYISNGSDRVVVFRLGTGATSAQGGILAEGEEYQVQFQARVISPTPGTSSLITNTAHITSQSDAGEKFKDENSASFEGPEAGPMPVTLSRFAASLLDNSTAQLEWTTSTEINNDHFVIERSLDANNFSAVATVDGNGTSYVQHNYSLNDDISSVNSSVVYYRLRQVDFDGRSNLSNIVAVKLQKSVQRALISPNPFSSYVNINTDWNQTEDATVRILNVQGKVLMSKSVHMNRGNNQFKVDNLSVLPSGNYYLQIVSPKGKIIEKIVK